MLREDTLRSKSESEVNKRFHDGEELALKIEHSRRGDVATFSENHHFGFLEIESEVILFRIFTDRIDSILEALGGVTKTNEVVSKE